MARKPKDNSPIAIDVPPAKLLARKVALWGLVAALGATAIGLGFNRLKTYVATSYATPSEPPRVVLKSRPAWMNEFLADRIARVARPTQISSAFDRDVLVNVRNRLSADPNVAPWIEKISSIRRIYGGAPGDTIEIDATFRAPVALVRYGDEFWLVDSKGVKLPEKFDADQVPKIVLGQDGKPVIRIVEGVRNIPPEAGFIWKGGDVQAGIDLLKVIHEKPFAQEILKVDVANYNGRRDPAAAQLVLITRYNTEIRWGRPINTKDYFFEVSPSRKLEVLERVVAEYGQVDARRPWLDIRFDKPNAPRQAPTGSEATTAADTR